ncbi:mCG145889, partial [Mus musculus]
RRLQGPWCSCPRDRPRLGSRPRWRICAQRQGLEGLCSPRRRLAWIVWEAGDSRSSNWASSFFALQTRTALLEQSWGARNMSTPSVWISSVPPEFHASSSSGGHHQAWKSSNERSYRGTYTIRCLRAYQR